MRPLVDMAAMLIASCLLFSLILHALYGLGKRGGRFGVQHVYILCIAGDVVLLAFLQHIRIECGSDAGSQYHAYGNHGTYPGRKIFVRHALGGVGWNQRVEEHHAGGADDDRILHPFVQSCTLYLEIHEHGGKPQ